METIIREGTLRLQTSDSSCDVILNCKGQRLMAHKLILSIASPVLRDLLVQSSEPSLLIFPDVAENTMSLVLDYIYTGSVVLYSNTIKDFLSIAHLLKLELDEEYLGKPKHGDTENDNCSENKNVEKLQVLKCETKTEIISNKNQRKLPNLVPIARSLEKRRQQILCDYVLPNPWKPRISSVLEDPKKGYPARSEKQCKFSENDSNNNFYLSDDIKIPTFLSKTPPEKLIPLDFHMLNRFPIGKNASQMKINNSTDGKKDIAEGPTHSEEIKYNNSDNNTLTSFHILTSRNMGKGPSIISKISEQEDEETYVAEESEKWDENKNEGHKKLNEKPLRSKDREKNKPFTCEDCGKSFSQLRNYKYHRSIHEGTREFSAKCQECGKVFNDRGYLSSHMKIHKDEKEYACPDCPKRFNQRVAYNMHLRIHTGIKPHECQTCGKSFSRKMLLKQHQRVHTGERPYTCPECGKTFADRSNMSLHARLHTGVKPYACSLCSKSFTKKHHLKTHMNFHTGVKPYFCQKCGLSFSQSSNMRTHFKKCILRRASSLGDTNTDSTSETPEEKL